MPSFVPINGLHHFAYRCRDAEETRHFYEDILGLPLIHVIRQDRVPSTQEHCPHAHIFFRMTDGSCVAFFDLGDNQIAAPRPIRPNGLIISRCALARSMNSGRAQAPCGCRYRGAGADRPSLHQVDLLLRPQWNPAGTDHADPSQRSSDAREIRAQRARRTRGVGARKKSARVRCGPLDTRGVRQAIVRQ